jgi:hypothetical protein
MVLRRLTHKWLQVNEAGGAADIYGQVMRAARSAKSDGDAMPALVTSVAVAQAGAQRALAILSVRRSDYLSDRAFRLLSAAMVPGATVVPEEGTGGSLYRQEERLGRLPLKQAYAELVEREPRLREVDPAAQAKQAIDGLEEPGKRTSPSVEALVGPRAEHADPVMRSRLALDIARCYIQSAKEQRNEKLDVSYFANPACLVTLSGERETRDRW